LLNALNLYLFLNFCLIKHLPYVPKKNINTRYLNISSVRDQTYNLIHISITIIYVHNIICQITNTQVSISNNRVHTLKHLWE